MGSVKRCLRTNIGRAALDVQQIVTILTEVEAVINSRPMTYVYFEPNEPSVLTPAHFLCGTRLKTLPHQRGGVVTSTRTELVRRWLQPPAFDEYVLKPMGEEYLYKVRSAPARKPRNSSSLNVWDIVIAHDDHVPRTFWKKAEFEVLYRSRRECVCL